MYVCRSVLSQHEVWHKCCWSELDTAELLEGVEKQQQRVAALPQKVVQDWDVYLHLKQAVATICLSIPMLEGLKRYLFVLVCVA